MFRTIALPLALVAVTAVAFVVSLGHSTAPVAKPPGAQPHLIAPADVNFGKRSLGEVVSETVVFRNDGSAPLTVSDFRTDCSCSGLERVIDERAEAVEKLHVPAGGSETLRVRLIVRGRSSGQQVSAIRFNTDDPTQPQGAFRLIVPFIKNGLIALPAEVHIGAVLVGSTHVRELDLYDDAKEPIPSATVAPVSDARMAVAFLSADHHKPPPGQPSYGKHVGRVRLTLNASSPGEVRGTVSVIGIGRSDAPTEVPFSASVRRPVQCVPERLSLDADTLTGRVLIRSHIAAVRAVREAKSPVGFVVRPSTTDGPVPVVPCVVEWDGLGYAAAAAGVHTLTVLIELADGTTTSVVVSVEKVAPEK